MAGRDLAKLGKSIVDGQLSPTAFTSDVTNATPLVYDSTGLLPLSNLSIGDTAFVTSNSGYYVSNGTTWYRINISDGNGLIPVQDEPYWRVTTQQQKIQAADAEAGDRFGEHVSISGDTFVAGAPFEATGGSGTGAAYIFTRSGSTWTQQQKIQASDAQGSDNFGTAVGIDGDTVIVGADGEDAGGSAAGAAYVFTRSGSTWTQQQKLVASDAAANDNFGFSVAIDGDTVIVGAYAEDGGTGAAYVFTRSGSTWTQQQKLVASDGAALDYYGISVAIDGDTAVVGTWEAETVYVYTRSGSTWTEQQKIVASDSQADDEFGRYVAISGDTVVAGATDEDTGAANAGSVYIFTRSGSTWTEQQKIQASDKEAQDQFGRSVGIDGNTVVVGAWLEDTGGTSAGAAYIFTRDGSTWTQQQKIQSSDIEEGDQFGYRVSISGDTVAVGARYEDTGGGNAGAAYIFVGG